MAYRSQQTTNYRLTPPAKQALPPDALSADGMVEKVIYINRCAKVVKGGRRFSFSALVVVGNGNGIVGLGFGKAKEVPMAIQKGIVAARKNLFTVPINDTTIYHPSQVRYAGSMVLMKPAGKGTGVIAGGAVRQVLEAAGIKDVLTKNLGSTNPVNSAKATILGLMQQRSPEQVRELRGKQVKKAAEGEA